MSRYPWTALIGVPVRGRASRAGARRTPGTSCSRRRRAAGRSSRRADVRTFDSEPPTRRARAPVGRCYHPAMPRSKSKRSRYRPPPRKKRKPSPKWFGALILTCFVARRRRDHPQLPQHRARGHARVVSDRRPDRDRRRVHPGDAVVLARAGRSSPRRADPCPSTSTAARACGHHSSSCSRWAPPSPRPVSRLRRRAARAYGRVAVTFGGWGFSKTDALLPEGRRGGRTSKTLRSKAEEISSGG